MINACEVLKILGVPEERAGLFYLLAVLGLVPAALTKFHAINIPDDIIRDTLNIKPNVDLPEYS